MVVIEGLGCFGSLLYYLWSVLAWLMSLCFAWLGFGVLRFGCIVLWWIWLFCNFVCLLVRIGEFGFMFRCMGWFCIWIIQISRFFAVCLACCVVLTSLVVGAWLHLLPFAFCLCWWLALAFIGTLGGRLDDMLLVWFWFKLCFLDVLVDLMTSSGFCWLTWVLC